jgi:hypothetical protein
MAPPPSGGLPSWLLSWAWPTAMRCWGRHDRRAHQSAGLGSIRAHGGERPAIRIGSAYPAGPPVRELDEALTAVRNSAAAGYDAIAARLGWDFHPPSPCHPA